ncbi:MAG: serine/threonine protein phosphatase [Candidatus Babeliaceae bacterium]|nr:serine/threonine protein phosphatase [Candidatus Babeliaceae bacterium]
MKNAAVFFIFCVFSLQCSEMTYQQFVGCCKKGEIIPVKEVKTVVNSVVEKINERRSKGTWFGGDAPREYAEHSAIIEKLFVQKGEKNLTLGDRHGDLENTLSLIRKLENDTKQNILGGGSGFKILDKNMRMTFLGDYADRGSFGVEVIYFVSRLFLENPDKVILIRGNHEEEYAASCYGLKDEIAKKYGFWLKSSLFSIFKKFFRCLSSVVFIGVKSKKNSKDVTRYGAFCHAGLSEYDFDYEDFLRDKSLFGYIESDKPLGIRWHDYVLEGNSIRYNTDRDVGLFIPITESDKMLKNISSEEHQVDYVFRGHQQGAFIPDISEGGGFAILGKKKQSPDTCLNKGDVSTFAVGPEGYEYLFKEAKIPPYDGCGIITVGDGVPGSWKCKGYKIECKKPTK